MRFSERLGYKSVRESLQVECIDQVLYNKLWNLLLYTLFGRMRNMDYKVVQMFCNIIWTQFLDERLDETPSYSTNWGKDFTKKFKDIFFNFEW